MNNEYVLIYWMASLLGCIICYCLGRMHQANKDRKWYNKGRQI